MELSVAIRLIEKGVVRSDHTQVWADLGAGTGLFTQALLTQLSTSSLVHAVDRDQRGLSTLVKESRSDQVKTHVLNFEHEDLPFSELDGVLLANALHFVKDQQGFLMKVKGYLKPGGRLILIEYDLPKPNPWVPYPIKFADLPKTIEPSGFRSIQKLEQEPSRFNASMIYACLIQG